MFHWGLGVIPKTDDEIYVSISVGKYMITSNLFSVLCQRRSCCWNYQKWGSHLKLCHLCKGGRKCKDNFFNQSLLHPVIFSKGEPQTFWSTFGSCSLQWRGWQHYECARLSALKYCQSHSGHLLAFWKTAIKTPKQGVKFVQTYQAYYNNWLSSC